jgi:hypothetical protein
LRTQAFECGKLLSSTHPSLEGVSFVHSMNRYDAITKKGASDAEKEKKGDK